MPLQWDRNGVGVSKKRSLVFLLIKKSIKVSYLDFIGLKSSGWEQKRARQAAEFLLPEPAGFFHSRHGDFWTGAIATAGANSSFTFHRFLDFSYIEVGKAGAKNNRLYTLFFHQLFSHLQSFSLAVNNVAKNLAIPVSIWHLSFEPSASGAWAIKAVLNLSILIPPIKNLLIVFIAYFYGIFITSCGPNNFQQK